jgi:hypothetical protein
MNASLLYRSAGEDYVIGAYGAKSSGAGRIRKAIPQGLKPLILRVFCGTAEAVPLSKAQLHHPYAFDSAGILRYG